MQLKKYGSERDYCLTICLTSKFFKIYFEMRLMSASHFVFKEKNRCLFFFKSGKSLSRKCLWFRWSNTKCKWKKKYFAIGKFGRELVFNEKYNTVLIYGFKIFLNSTFTAHIHWWSEKIYWRIQWPLVSLVGCSHVHLSKLSLLCLHSEV